MINRNWIEEPARIKEEVCQFYRRKFGEEDKERQTLEGISFEIISQSQNELLMQPFDEKEIRDIVWDCGSHKSPRPNGLNFKFIKEFWDLIKPEMLRFLDEFYVNGRFPKGTNASFIILIPKVLEPQNLNQYKPISLIGCIYKIVAKVLARRLKMMPKIIDERRSAFIEGRHVLHSVLIANEAVEEVKRNVKSCLIFKVDYERAYDSVS